MKANLQKSDDVLSSNIQRRVPFGNVQITGSLKEKSLRVTFDLELNFEEHISKICSIVNKKRNSLLAITNHMSLIKGKLLLKALQISVLSANLKFHSRTLNYKRSRLHKNALRIVYTDFKANFENLQYPLQKCSKFVFSNIKVFEWAIPDNNE